ncbi:hypothetical protein Droror1_Dr00015540 [Drosera rotundifolia]
MSNLHNLEIAGSAPPPGPFRLWLRPGEGKMSHRAKMNAMRSTLVVVGSLAFGYLTLQLGFRPFLEKAREAAAATAEMELEQSRKASDTVDGGLVSEFSDDSSGSGGFGFVDGNSR